MRITTAQIRQIIREELEKQKELQKYMDYFLLDCRRKHADCGDTDDCMDEFMNCQDKGSIIKKATQALKIKAKLGNSDEERELKAKKEYFFNRNEKKRKKLGKYVNHIKIILFMKKKWTALEDDEKAKECVSVEDLFEVLGTYNHKEVEKNLRRWSRRILATY